MKVISVDELMDDGEYEEILEDMREEGRKFGNKHPHISLMLELRLLFYTP